MDRPWQAEHAVSAQQARRMIAAQFPALAGTEVVPLGFGWDNSVFAVDHRWVFRFPRRTIAASLLETECRLLPVLSEHLPLPIPVPIHRGAPDAEYPWPFAGYTLLPGRTACVADLDAGARAAAAAALADFLSALHGFPAATARAVGTPDDHLARADVKRRLPVVEQRLAACVESGFVDDAGPLHRILEDAPLDFEPRGDVLCHGDLYARHLLVDSAGTPSGVIDWGDVHLGDPATDLGIVFGFLPPSAADTFFGRYSHAITDAQRRAARFRALHYATMLPVYGKDVGDAALVREGITALGYLGGELPALRATRKPSAT